MPCEDDRCDSIKSSLCFIIGLPFALLALLVSLLGLIVLIVVLTLSCICPCLCAIAFVHYAWELIKEIAWKLIMAPIHVMKWFTW
ncbi:signaling peptide TAXIMIN 1-like [Capsicum chacoense]